MTRKLNVWLQITITSGRKLFDRSLSIIIIDEGNLFQLFVIIIDEENYSVAHNNVKYKAEINNYPRNF